jgi:hypothetical protein
MIIEDRLHVNAWPQASGGLESHTVGKFMKPERLAGKGVIAHREAHMAEKERFREVLHTRRLHQLCDSMVK